MPKDIILRSSYETRASVDPLEGVIDGYPIVFNKRANIAGLFYEVIDPHALDDANLEDIKFLANHESRMIPLARHRRGKRSTMDIAIDDKGLKVHTKLDIEHNATAATLVSAVDRGDITDMSFAFGIVVDGEEWSDLKSKMPTRRITKISRVTEVSAVNDGAYSATSISARSSDSALENEKKALDNAITAALENEKRASERADFELSKRKYKFIKMEEEK